MPSYGFWYQDLYMSEYFVYQQVFWLHVPGCDKKIFQYLHIHYFFSLLPLFSWFWNKASWAEPRSTLAKNCNISFPHCMRLQSKDIKYKCKEFSLKKKKNCKLPHKSNSFHRSFMLCLRKMIQCHFSKCTKIIKMTPHAQCLSFSLCFSSAAEPGSLVTPPAPISSIKSGGRIEKERRDLLNK